jgi:hypothetical protein
MTPQTHQPAQTPPPARRRAAGAGDRPDAPRASVNPAWVLLLPLLCCGGPVLLTAAVSAGALGWGALGAGIAALVAAGVLVTRRHITRCCAPAVGDAPSQRRAARAPDGDPHW